MSLATVRTIISDPQQYGSAEALADGSNVEFNFPNSPIYPGTAKVYIGEALQTETTDYTVEEDIGLVTFVTAPPAESIVTITCRFTILSDAQIQSMLDLNVDSDQAVRLAAADCLDIIASSETLIQKRLKLLDLETDGPAEAKSLREHAKNLRAIALASGEDSEPCFDIAEQINNSAGYAEKLRKDFEREL